MRTNSGSMNRRIPHHIFRHKVILVTTIMILSIAFTLASFQYQRFGPEYGYLGNECKPECLVLKLNGGWPLPYVFDRMGISVMNVLHIEDEVRLVPFFIDIGFYAVTIFSIVICSRWLIQMRSNSIHHIVSEREQME
jgi:hypothetical protein